MRGKKMAGAAVGLVLIGGGLGQPIVHHPRQSLSELDRNRQVEQMKDYAEWEKLQRERQAGQVIVALAKRRIP
jgi:hypothetical protein